MDYLILITSSRTILPDSNVGYTLNKGNDRFPHRPYRMACYGLSLELAKVMANVGYDVQVPFSRTGK